MWPCSISTRWTKNSCDIISPICIPCEKLTRQVFLLSNLYELGINLWVWSGSDTHSRLFVVQCCNDAKALRHSNLVGTVWYGLVSAVYLLAMPYLFIVLSRAPHGILISVAMPLPSVALSYQVLDTSFTLVEISIQTLFPVTMVNTRSYILPSLLVREPTNVAFDWANDFHCRVPSFICGADSIQPHVASHIK